MGEGTDRGAGGIALPAGASELHSRQARVLGIVLGINLALFAVQLPLGIAASSTALVADGLDMLNDAIVYAVSLLIVARSQVCKARAAIGSGIAMLALAAFVFVQGIDKAFDPRVPDLLLLEAGAFAALAGNGLCCRLLGRHRGDDVAMASAWLCSRNDMLANVLIVVAGIAGHISGSQLPDLAVGLAIAALFARSGLDVIARGRRAHADRSHRAASSLGAAIR